MSEDLLVKAECRKKLGTVDSKRLQAGRVPANLYGMGKRGGCFRLFGNRGKIVATLSSVVDVEWTVR